MVYFMFERFQGSADGIIWTLDTFMRIFLGKLNSYPFSFSFGYVLLCYLLLGNIPQTLLFRLNLIPFGFLIHFVTLADKVFGLKSIAAYRSGLKINTNVTLEEAQEGLTEVLRGEYLHLQSPIHFNRKILKIHSVLPAGNPVRITNKHLIDYIFMRSLEVAVSYDLPLQIHTG